MAEGSTIGVWPRHVYARASGVIVRSSDLQPVEEWSIGVRVAWGEVERLDGRGIAHTFTPIPPVINQSIVETYLREYVVGAFRELLTGANTSPWLRCTKISANMLVDSTGTSARYQYDHATEVEPGVTGGISAIQGGGSQTGGMAGHHPPQCSLVATFGTLATRGPGARGRIFLPGVIGELDPSWRLPTEKQEQVAGRVQDFLRGLVWLWDTDPVSSDKGFVPAVVSPRGLNGTMRAITAVRVGRVWDTQRSRRNQLDEDYATFAMDYRPN